MVRIFVETRRASRLLKQIIRSSFLCICASAFTWEKVFGVFIRDSKQKHHIVFNGCVCVPSEELCMHSRLCGAGRRWRAFGENHIASKTNCVYRRVGRETPETGRNMHSFAPHVNTMRMRNENSRWPHPRMKCKQCVRRRAKCGTEKNPLAIWTRANTRQNPSNARSSTKYSVI